MPLPDLGALAEAGGWVVAVAVTLGFIGLFVLGKIVAGPTHHREMTRADQLDERLDALVDTVREQTGHMRTLLALQERDRGPR